MATDDDKQIPEPDPWAGLDIGGAEDKGDDFTFSFEGPEDDAAARVEPDEPALDGDLSVDDGHRDEASDDIPLAVFPPPDAEATGSEIEIGTGRSGIISLPNAENATGEEDVAGRYSDDDGFDDEDIAHELGLADVEGDAVAAGSIGGQDEPDGMADFGEPFAEAQSDDVSFDAGMMSGGSPFADSEQADPPVDAADAWQDDPASIPLTAAVAAAGAAVASAPAGGRQPAARKKAGGLGQMVGVVLGGLMALPITYAILIWGFQKDPFKLGRQVPEQLAFLLPQKLQPGYKPPKKANAGPNNAGPSLDAAPSLDDLPMAEESAAGSTPEPDATATTEPAEPEPTEPVEPDASEPLKPEPLKTDALAETPADPAAPLPTEPDDAPNPAAEPASESLAASDAAGPAMAADTRLAALPQSDLLPADSLPGLDTLIADAGAAVVASAPAAAPVLPPLDLSGVDMAAERATQALEAVDAMTDPISPDRDRLLVAWYKRLAELGEELVRLETTAADSGRPLASTPASAADLLDRICLSDTAVADLDRLGGMWLTSQKRRADGVALIVTLGASRQVGPYWSTRAVVSGPRADGNDRSMAIISRLAPPVDAGEQVVVSGVMFDGDAVWAADIRPVAPQPSSDDGQE